MAVGAPFEDEMRGAVYIFNGCSRDCVKMWAYSQKIKASTIHEDLQGFGSYISRTPEDIDNNEFRGRRSLVTRIACSLRCNKLHLFIALIDQF